MMTIEAYKAMRDSSVQALLANPVVDPADYDETAPLIFSTGTNAYSAVMYLVQIAGYYKGMTVQIQFTNANSGPSSLNINGYGIVPLVKDVSSALAAGDILAGGIYDLVHDGTNFQLQSPANSSGSGSVTSVSVVTNQGVSGSVANPTTAPAITLTLGALTGVTSFNGLIITADTGVITTGTWNGTAIANANLANSTITIGSTSITLGATSLTLAGLTSVTSTTFVGALTGNSTTSTTTTNITGGTAGAIPYQSGVSTTAMLAATATAGLALISGASTAPSWYVPTAGSVLFAGVAGKLEQDNANLFWDNTNNRLGIGTAAPVYNFHLYNNTVATDAYLAVQNTQAASQVAINLINSGTANANWVMYIPGSSSSLKLYNAGASPGDRLTITNDGKVGIGTTPIVSLDIVSPGNTPDNYFEVKANNLTQGIGIGYSWIRKIGSTANSDLFIDAAGTGHLVLQTNSTGYVGIGQPIPICSLHLKRATSCSVLAESDSVQVAFTAYGGSSRGEFGTITNHPLSFYTNSTARVSINIAGSFIIEGGNKLWMKNTVSNSNYWSAILSSGVLTWTDSGSATLPTT